MTGPGETWDPPTGCCLPKRGDRGVGLCPQGYGLGIGRAGAPGEKEWLGTAATPCRSVTRETFAQEPCIPTRSKHNFHLISVCEALLTTYISVQ